MEKHERLKKIREALNLSQTEFAETIGLKQGSYSPVEGGTGGISAAVLKLLELVHGVNREYVTNGEEPMFKGVSEDKADKKVTNQNNYMINEEKQFYMSLVNDLKATNRELSETNKILVEIVHSAGLSKAESA